MLRSKIILILLVMLVPLFASAQGLTVQYNCTETNTECNQIRFSINIVNNGNESENFTDLKARYYFTLESTVPQQYWIDYAAVGTENISGKFVQFGEKDYYLELSFSDNAGVLESGDESGEIQVRFNKADWTDYDQSDDYSFNPDITSFYEYEKITLYKNEQLIWGKVKDDIIINITSAKFYTRVSVENERETGHTFLFIVGNTNADVLNIKVWGGSEIGYVNIPVDIHGNFYETVEICYKHYPDETPFYISTDITAVKDNMTAVKELQSPELQYLKDIKLNITKKDFYTELEYMVNLKYGYTKLDIEGNTNASELKIKVWENDGIFYVDIPVDADGNFSETIVINSIQDPDDTPFTIITEVDASIGNYKITQELVSPELTYIKQEEWVPYYDNVAHITVSKNFMGEYEAEVKLHFASTGFKVTDWGTTENPDAKVMRYTGYHRKVYIDISHKYQLGILEPGEYTFDFKAWGKIITGITFTVIKPKVVITSPMEGSEYLTEDYADVFIQAEVEDYGVGIEEVFFVVSEINNPSNHIVIYSDYNAPYETTLKNLDPGKYKLNVSAIDLTGTAGHAQPVNFQVIKKNQQADLKLQYKCISQSDQSNSINAHLNILNTGAESVDMSELEIRYYYTLENADMQQFFCDYAMIGASNVAGNFVNAGNDNYYLSMTFKEGIIIAEDESGEIHIRWNKNNWSEMTQLNDYSFNSELTSFSDWNKITVFKNGKLVWGIEP